MRKLKELLDDMGGGGGGLKKQCAIRRIEANKGILPKISSFLTDQIIWLSKRAGI